MKYDHQIIVIGGGSAGLVVAAGAAGLGADVALVEREKMGGECLNSGCVPSKSFLRCAHRAAEIRESAGFGIIASLNGIDMEALFERVGGVIREIEPHDSEERFRSLGVNVVRGEARILGPHSVRVAEKEMSAKYIVIATGSEALVPPVRGLSVVPFYTNRNIFSLKKLPSNLVVLGGGAIGLELGQGFSHLGSKVTVIDMMDRLFARDDREVGPLMEKLIRGEGIEFHLRAKIIEVIQKDASGFVRIEKDKKIIEVPFDAILVALGRKAVTDGLGLAEAGVAVDEKGYVKTNLRQQTSAPGIYACGDVCGPYQFTHMAGYQAGIVLRNIIFKYPAKCDYSAVPWVTYTRPEVAHAGYTEEAAKGKGLFGESIFCDFSENDRARTEGDIPGFLNIVTDKKGRIIGATIVGRKAGEMIALSVMAIGRKLKATCFMNMVFPYPTESEIYGLASRNIAKKSLKPWMKRIVRMMV
jgi:pyruvate/2-oxoglutarate dehydrogenase complex dihydrolipoamide dehydrogenase (E3) component